MAYIVKQKNSRGGIDLYYTISYRAAGKAYSVQKRKYLGKLDIQNNEIIKNRKLSNLTADELKALRKDGIVFNGKESSPPGRKPTSKKTLGKNALRHWRSLEFGRVSVLKMLADKSELLPVLEEAFGQEDALKIFAAALFESVENAALYRAENWLDDTILAEEDIALSKSSLDRLVRPCSKRYHSHAESEWVPNLTCESRMNTLSGLHPRFTG